MPLVSYLNFRFETTEGFGAGFWRSIYSALRVRFWGAERDTFWNGIQLRFVPDADVDVTSFGAKCDFSAAFDLTGMFEQCRSLHLDCSDWDVSPNTLHSDSNKNVPGVILPKAWQ